MIFLTGPLMSQIMVSGLRISPPGRMALPACVLLGTLAPDVACELPLGFSSNVPPLSGSAKRYYFSFITNPPRNSVNFHRFYALEKFPYC